MNRRDLVLPLLSVFMLVNSIFACTGGVDGSWHTDVNEPAQTQMAITTTARYTTPPPTAATAPTEEIVEETGAPSPAPSQSVTLTLGPTATATETPSRTPWPTPTQIQTYPVPGSRTAVPFWGLAANLIDPPGGNDHTSKEAQEEDTTVSNAVDFTQLFIVLTYLAGPAGMIAWMLFWVNAARNLRYANIADLEKKSPFDAGIARWIQALTPLRWQIFFTFIAGAVPSLAALILYIVPVSVIEALQPFYGYVALLLLTWIGGQFWYQLTKDRSTPMTAPDAAAQPNDNSSGVPDAVLVAAITAAIMMPEIIEPFSRKVLDRVNELLANAVILPEAPKG